MDLSESAWGIIGHARQIDQLERAIRRGTVAHAYLITGPARVGKTALALALARRLCCVGDPPPCGVCRPCRAIAAGTFPDLTLVEPLAAEGAGADNAEGGRKRWITIGQVRELQRTINLTPYEAKRKFALILDAENLQGPASDALLKTLEEPPPRSGLILTAADARALAPTIVSRCQTIALSPVPEPTLAAALEARGVLRTTAERLARLARGRPGWALAACDDPQLVEQTERWLRDWLAQLEADTPARLAFAQALEKTFKEDRAGFEEGLDIWLGWWRDLLLVRAGCADLAVNAEHLATLRRWAERLTAEEIVACIHAIQSTLVSLGQNANPRLTLEAMLIGLPTDRLSGARG